LIVFSLWKYRALRLLLDLGEDYWPIALKFVEAHQNQTTEHFELFHILLLYCLDQKQSIEGTKSRVLLQFDNQQSSQSSQQQQQQQQQHDKLTQIWPLRPQRFTPLDFLSILDSITNEKLKAKSSDNSRSFDNKVVAESDHQSKETSVLLPFSQNQQTTRTLGSLRTQLMTFAINASLSQHPRDERGFTLEKMN
jgi:hypothetical protein